MRCCTFLFLICLVRLAPESSREQAGLFAVRSAICVAVLFIVPGICLLFFALLVRYAPPTGWAAVGLLNLIVSWREAKYRERYPCRISISQKRIKECSTKKEWQSTVIARIFFQV